MIETRAIRWLGIIFGLGVATIVFPPLGLLGVVVLIVCVVARRIEAHRARATPETVSYWTPERMNQTYFS